MRPRLDYLAALVADEVPELGNERAVLNFLLSVGYPLASVAPLINVIISLARDLRAEAAERLAVEVE
jgi:hypothetical protein